LLKACVELLPVALDKNRLHRRHRRWPGEPEDLSSHHWNEGSPRREILKVIERQVPHVPSQQKPDVLENVRQSVRAAMA
jgi:hypothetical protein